MLGAARQGEVAAATADLRLARASTFNLNDEACLFAAWPMRVYFNVKKPAFPLACPQCTVLCEH
jgi:hypothetical protein